MTGRVPVVLQKEVAECGLACVAMICGYHGKQMDLDSLRKISDPSTRGSTMKDLVDVADAVGFNVKSLKIGMRQIDKLTLPAIIHWNVIHYVVLVSQHNDSYVVHDPALGRRVLTKMDFSRSFTGLAQEFTARPDFTREDNRKAVPLAWLLGKDSTYGKLLGSILALTFVMQVLVAVVPFAGQALLDNVLTTRDQTPLAFGLVAGAMGLFLYCTLVWTRSTLALFLNSCLDTVGTQRLIGKMLSMPYEFFARRDIGSMLSRFANMIELRRLLTQGLAESAVEAIIGVLVFLAVLLYLPAAGLISVLCLLAYVAMRAGFRESDRERVGEMFHAASGQSASLIETLAKIETVKANALETARQRFWMARFATYQNAVVRKSRAEYTNGIALVCCMGGGYGLCLWFIVSAVFDTTLSVGEGFTVFILTAIFLSRSSICVNRVFEVLIAKVHLDNLGDVVHGESEPLPEVLRSSDDFRGTIELQDVGFRYSTNEPFVFRHVSLAIDPGMCVAITGPSGCGKSTLLSLILGLRTPTEGQILVDGLPVQDWDLRRLRRRIGSVLQADQLFIGSLHENVTLFDVNPTDDFFNEVVDSCALRHVVGRLGMGIHTIIGDTPTLSGGERQRLLLARALYKKPSILVLDEATSHLDEATEAQVNTSIRASGATRVMVAHRRQTIDLADIEVVLSRGGNTWSTVTDVRSKRAGLHEEHGAQIASMGLNV